jgi:hypothetical protein
VDGSVCCDGVHRARRSNETIFEWDHLFISFTFRPLPKAAIHERASRVHASRGSCCEGHGSAKKRR